jgi:hypothetical protein
VNLSFTGRLKRFALWKIFYAFNYAYRWEFYRQNPILMKTVLAFQKQRPISKEDRAHVLRWFHHHAGSYQFFKTYKKREEVMIFDEGFVHRVVQLFASANETPHPLDVKKYIDLIPRPELVIVPIASSEVCERRVYERGLWERFKMREPAETSRYINNAHSVVSYAVEFIKEKGWTVIEVNNDLVELRKSTSGLRQSLFDLGIQYSQEVYSIG